MSQIRRVKTFLPILLLAVMCAVASAQTPLRLAAAIAAGLAHNPDLRAKTAALGIARSLRTESWLPFPSPLTADYQNSSDRRFANQGESRRDFALSQEVEWPGPYLLRLRAANLTAKSAEAEARQFESNTVANIKEAFFRLLAEQFKRAVADSIAAFNERLAASAKQRFDAGDISELNYNLALVERDQSLVERNDAEVRHRNAMIALSRLLGRSLEETVFAATDTATLVQTFDENKLLEIALRRRGDWQSAQFAAGAASRSVGLTWMRFIPNPVFSASWNTDRAVFVGDDILGNPAIVNGITRISDRDRLFTFRVGFALPLFNFNLAGASVQRANAEKSAAHAQMEAARLTVMAEVQAASKRFELAQASWRRYQEIFPRLQTNLALLVRAYEAGEIDLPTLLVQQDRLFRTRLAYYDSFLEYHSALAELERAVGGKLAE